MICNVFTKFSHDSVTMDNIGEYVEACMHVILLKFYIFSFLQDNSTALHEAAKHNKLGIVKLLVDEHLVQT